MAIAKGDSLKSITLRDYMKSVGAAEYALSNSKSVVLLRDAGEVYLGYVMRSKTHKLGDVSLNDNILLDGAHGKDWLSGPMNHKWTKGE